MNRKHRIHSRALLLATAGVIALAATPALAGEIIGEVTDGSGFKGLPGAQVTLVESNRRTEVETNGSFRFADVPAGDYTLTIQYVGAETVEKKITVPATGVVNASVRVGPAADNLVDSVIVVGQAANQAGALSRQRAADGVESVLTRDAIGQFPDQNVAESLRRLPGVNILDDQGEGRFVAVRGLDPELNSASINGARVPAPESDVRSVALDVVPTELVESIEVKKSLTPDMDADTIGASIEIKTTSSLDSRKSFVAGSVEGSYNDANGEWSPKASFDFSTRISDRFGISGGVSYYKRSFATDNIEADDWDENGGIVSAKTLEYRDYDVERKRLGASLSLDLRATDNTDLYLRLLTSKFDDQEYRRRLILEMDGDPFSGASTTALFRSTDDRITAIRDLKDRFESQTINSLVFGGRTETGPWRFDYSASWSKSREKEAGSVDPFRFRQRFTGNSLQVEFDYANMEKPGYEIISGLTNFLDPTRYQFYRFERSTLSLSEDEESTIKGDFRREFVLDSGDFDLQGGFKVRRRTKSYNFEEDYYDGYAGGLRMTDFVGQQTYNLADIDPVMAENSAAAFFRANAANFERSDLDSAFESAAADYDVDENIDAAYLLGKYDTGTLKVVGGLRVEHTENEIHGNLVELVEGGATYNGSVVPDDTVFVTPLKFTKDYTHWLPSVVATWEPADDLIVRGGMYRSVVRPKLGKMAPRFIVEQDDNDVREGEFGNPDLKPYDAWNYDLSVEWYFGKNAVLQGGLFYKTIKDFVVDAEFNNITYNGIYADEAIIPINGDEATVVGFEFNYQQAMSFLPDPFDGLLLGFNFTYTDSEGDVGGRTIPLPAASERTYNALLGYEKGPVSLRLSASYRSEYLDELGSSAETDRWVKEHLQFDFSGKYRVNKQVTVFGELVNINDEPYVAYQKGPVRARLLQYEEYSFTVKTGVKVRF